MMRPMPAVLAMRRVGRRMERVTAIAVHLFGIFLAPKVAHVAAMLARLAAHHRQLFGAPEVQAIERAELAAMPVLEWLAPFDPPRAIPQKAESHLVYSGPHGLLVAS